MGAVSYAVNTMQPPFRLLVYRGWETSAILLCMASAQYLFLGITVPRRIPYEGESIHLCQSPCFYAHFPDTEGCPH